MLKARNFIEVVCEADVKDCSNGPFADLDGAEVMNLEVLENLDQKQQELKQRQQLQTLKQAANPHLELQ